MYPQERIDFTTRDEGTSLILWPKSKQGREYAAKEFCDFRRTWSGGYVIPERYAGWVLRYVKEAGLRAISEWMEHKPH
jgi:hypothetical protein